MEEGFFILYDGKSFFWKVNLQQEKENKINWGAMSNNRLVNLHVILDHQHDL